MKIDRLRLTDAVSVILSELLSYEHPANADGGVFVSVNYSNITTSLCDFYIDDIIL